MFSRRPSLKEIVDGPSFVEVCRSFVDLYGIGIKVFDADGTRLVDLKVGNGDFCGYVFSKAEGRRLCTATVKQVKEAHFEEGDPASVVVHPCFTGLKYVVVPVLHELDLMGRVILGPFVPADLEGLPESLTSISEDFDRAQARALMAKIQRAPESTVKRIIGHLRAVLDVIIHSGYKAWLTSAMHIEAVQDSHRELLEKNRMLEESVDKLKELDRLKSNFLATVSHELRTPLTSVIGYSEMLLEGLAGDLSDEQRSYVRTIMEKGENLLQMISSILDISKIESGKVTLNPTELDLSEVAEAAISTVVPQANKKKLRIEREIAPELPRVPGDKDKVRQCLVNLLSNAVKFTPEGRTITVIVDRYTGPRRYQPKDDADKAFSLFEPRENHFVRIAVRDEGIGIPRDKLQKVFDTFYQVDNSSTREYGGTGLGLAIVKSYIEAHGGEVWVDSELGKGSTFALVLPLEPSTGVTTRETSLE
ncbi:MAG: histidine kinase [Deltaproteobacteria bacterium]|nr:MAG: histidine kinase [Deltaproteobacteria bacterium]